MEKKIGKIEYEQIYFQWSSLMTTLGVSEKVGEDWWSILCRRYGEEWRYYHNLWHINHMMQLYSQWRERIADLSEVALAIYFHDIVYDPQSKDNEIQSIVLFEKFALDAHLSKELVSRVSQLIKSTISHSVEGKSDDLDQCLFLDFDLAILGQNTDRYKEYAAQIRQEYIHFEDEKYRAGRIKVLESLLKMPSLFASEELRAEFENQARMNMTKEIEDLQLYGNSPN